jgi:heparanase 1
LRGRTVACVKHALGSAALWLATLAGCGGHSQPVPTVDAGNGADAGGDVDGGADAITLAVGAEVRAEVGPGFLSVALDTQDVVAEHLDLTQPRLRQLGAALAPGILRVGGTKADVVHVDLSDQPVTTAPAPDKLVLDRATWNGVCALAQDFGAKLLVTLSAGPARRGPDGAWQADQASALVAYSRAHGCPVEVWELGNEISLYQLEYGFDVSAAQYGHDLETLRAALAPLDPNARVAGPSSPFAPVVGEFLTPKLEGLLVADPGAVDVVTWHYYPQQAPGCALSTRPAELETMLVPAHLAEVETWAGRVTGLVHDHAPAAEVWLGETGHAQCGGAPGISDRFVSSFWWLDQLARLARGGQRVVVRQTLVGSRYGLLREGSLDPTPDWFASLIWQRQMGPRVLDATLAGAGKDLLAYAHCAPAGGGVTVLLLNLAGTPSLPIAAKAALGGAEVRLLDADALDSETVRLNGAVLALGPDDAVPAMPAQPIEGALVMPAHSIAFLSFPGAAHPACL